MLRKIKLLRKKRKKNKANLLILNYLDFTKMPNGVLALTKMVRMRKEKLKCWEVVVIIDQGREMLGGKR